MSRRVHLRAFRNHSPTIPLPLDEFTHRFDEVKRLTSPRCLHAYGSRLTIDAAAPRCSLAACVTERENLVTSGRSIAQVNGAIWL